MYIIIRFLPYQLIIKKMKIYINKINRTFIISQGEDWLEAENVCDSFSGLFADKAGFVPTTKTTTESIN